MLLFIIAISVVLVFSFVCSICESVLLSINHAQIEALSRSHQVAGRLMTGFKRHIDIPIAAILILNTVAHTVGAAVAGASFSQVFNERLLWLFTVAFTLVVLLFTEIVPKTLGVSHANRLAAPVAYTISLLTFILKPLVLVSESISSRLRGGKAVPVTSVEEIRLLTALGRNEGIVGVGTADMIIGATLLRKIRAVDVLIPRQDVAFLSTTASTDEVLEILRETRFSRFPVSTSNELDDVCGVALAREILFWIHANPNREIDWPGLLTGPLVVPETARLNSLLQTFKQEKTHMAIVVDEFGSVEGIATMEDVIEEIVGDIEDESDEPSSQIWRRPDGSQEARGNTELRRVCAALGLDWTPDQEVTTIGGLLMERLGRIPAEGDEIEWRGYRLVVKAADERRVKLIRILPT